jgi:hypothetical protein
MVNPLHMIVVFGILGSNYALVPMVIVALVDARPGSTLLKSTGGRSYFIFISIAQHQEGRFAGIRYGVRRQHSRRVYAGIWRQQPRADGDHRRRHHPPPRFLNVLVLEQKTPGFPGVFSLNLSVISDRKNDGAVGPHSDV